MVILIKKEELEELLQSNVDAWLHIGGGANMDAFEFDPNIVDKDALDSLGYYSNRDSWIAGVQVKKILAYMDEHLQNPTPSAQNK